MRPWRWPVRSGRPPSSEEVVDGPIGTSDLYASIRLIVGPLADELDQSDKQAAARLLDMTLYCSPVLRGLEEVRQHFLMLGCWPDLHPDVAGIFRQAATNVFDGILSCIFAPGGRVMDQSRFLMEVEFLLYDFVARPASLDVWRESDPFRRNQQFGFGKLRDRRERGLGLEPGTVLPDRDEYSVHSAEVHPRPVAELTPGDEAADLRRFYLMSDLSDLYEHALRVLRVSVDALRVFASGSEDDVDVPDGRPVDPDVISQASEFIGNWTANRRVSRPESVPIKAADSRARPSDPGS